MDRLAVEFEGEEELGEGTIILPVVPFVVDITVGYYFLDVCDY
jgi:hypothetical protein